MKFTTPKERICILMADGRERTMSEIIERLDLDRKEASRLFVKLQRMGILKSTKIGETRAYRATTEATS